MLCCTLLSHSRRPWSIRTAPVGPPGTPAVSTARTIRRPKGGEVEEDGWDSEAGWGGSDADAAGDPLRSAVEAEVVKVVPVEVMLLPPRPMPVPQLLMLPLVPLLVIAVGGLYTQSGAPDIPGLPLQVVSTKFSSSSSARYLSRGAGSKGGRSILRA